MQAIFKEVVEEKEAILEQKARSFVPTAITELKALLESYKEKASKRLGVLEGNDREQLLEQKQQIETQMGNIKADIAAVFGELGAKLETEKASGIRDLRSAGKDYTDLKEHRGERTVTESYTVSDAKLLKPWTWGKSHKEYSSHTEHYSYCIASDAIDNLRKYSIDAVNQIEEVFTDALQLKEIKRKLLNVVVNNFDMGNANYDSSLFRIMVEETVSAIEFPVFQMDISDAMNAITAKFSGEITSPDQKTALSTALSNAISRIYDELCNTLTSAVKKFKKEMEEISKKIQTSLLDNITKEFEELLLQCENKEREIAEYKSYILVLESELVKL